MLPSLGKGCRTVVCITKKNRVVGARRTKIQLNLDSFCKDTAKPGQVLQRRTSIQLNLDGF
jgi:hypothetical protein